MKIKITNGPNFVDKREGRPSYNSYYPSRRALLRMGKMVGRKARKK